MACCGAPEEDKSFEDQPHFAHNCIIDFRQQACTSIPVGLQKIIEDGTVPGAIKQRAIDIQNYLAAHTQDCFESLGEGEYPSFNDLIATWNLPDEGPWAPELSGVYVSVITSITDVYLPEEPAICESLDDNNMEVFSEVPNPLIEAYPLELENAEGALLGPLYGGDRVQTREAFASQMTSCADPWCSRALISRDPSGVWGIDQLILHVDGALEITAGAEQLTVTDARVELYGAARGVWGDGVYEIAAGDAHFVVVGQAKGEWVTLNVTNSTPILADEQATQWALERFELEYVDDQKERWTLTVGPSLWF